MLKLGDKIVFADDVREVFVVIIVNGILYIEREIYSNDSNNVFRLPCDTNWRYAQ